MTKQYLIAVDLDGTLVTDFDKYDEKSINYLKELAEKHYVVIATGRPYRSSRYYYDMMGLKTPIINYNGALVHHPSDPAFKKTWITIDHQVVFDLIRDMSDILVNVFCEIEDDIFLWKDNEEIRPYLHLDGGTLTTGNLDKILKGNPNGAIVLSKFGCDEQLKQYIRNKYHGTIQIRFWNANDIAVSEIYSPLTSKGSALRMIAQYLGVSKENIIAIGDANNDIEMLEFAKVGVAMGNCNPEVVKAADIQTTSIENHGVYEFLHDFFSKK